MKASLRDAIDQDVFRIDDDQYSDADFQAMSIDELERLKLRINKKSATFQPQLPKKKWIMPTAKKLSRMTGL
jgi:protoheme ferro-lyase